MSLGRHNSYFGTGSDLMSTYDLETGEHRPSGLADVARAARLCDALPNIDFVMSCAHPNDIEPQRSYLESFKAMVANTTKPMVMTSEHGGDLAVMCAIAEALRGGPDELAAKPYFTMYLEPVSPLSHPVESIDKLLFCADHGIPAIYSPAPLAGGTAPITVAGHTCQGVAESLFGLVIHQLRKPGAPFLFGIGPAVLDMATSQSSYNAPEYLMTFLCQIEMARWLDLPNWGYGGTSDSQVVDAQAGMEIGELAFLCLAAGSNLNHDVGYLDFGLTASLELIVIVDEYIALNRKLFAGVEVTPETLAVDVVRDVGPGGDFLAHRHTAKNVRKAQWRPTIINRQGHVRWAEEGGLDLAEKARLQGPQAARDAPARAAAGRAGGAHRRAGRGVHARRSRGGRRDGGLSRGRPHLVPDRRRQGRDLRGRARDHGHHRPARASPGGAGAAARGRRRDRRAGPGEGPARARGEGAAHGAGGHRGLRPRRRARHVARPLQLVLRQRLGGHQRLRRGDRRAPAHRPRRRRDGARASATRSRRSTSSWPTRIRATSTRTSRCWRASARW